MYYLYLKVVISYLLFSVMNIYIACEDIIGVETDVHVLTSSSEQLMLSKQATNRLEIFCYKGEGQTFKTILKTVELVVKVPNDNFRYYEGKNTSAIRQEFADSSWFSFTPWRPSSFRLNIYNFSCIGIESPESYKVALKIRYVDLWRVLILGIGLVLFIMAPLLAHNVMFHYVTGVTLGVFGSLLVVVFLLSKMVPKKTGAVSFLIGGWGLVLYLLQYFWSNSLILLKEYQTAVAGYIGIAGILSFVIVYRLGPVSDRRSLQLVQWSLQLSALASIFFSSQYREFTLSVVIILLAHYNVPNSWKFKFRTYWLRKFPPKPRILSEDEYLEQSRVETKKALDDLRQFCHSPDCNSWKTMSRLQSPKRYDERTVTRSRVAPTGPKLSNFDRFAEFVEGSSHLVDDEILSYESANYSRGSLQDDEEELITTDEDC